MRFLVALALLGVALAGYPQVSTRDGCPPTGYTALSGAWKLDNLPAYGKYAICLTPAEAASINPASLFNFTWNGVFKLTKSRLLVDRQIRIYAKYPSRVEWNDVTVTQFSEEDSFEDDGDWSGIRLEGAPPNLPYPGWLKSKKFGNCGTLNDVSIDEVRSDEENAIHPLDIVNCSGYYTKFKDISILADDYDNDQDGVRVTDSMQLVFEHLTVALLNGPENPTVADAVQVVRSEAAFIRPILYSAFGDAFDVEDFSNITVCDGFLRADDSNAPDDTDADYELGTVDDSDAGSVIVAVAGRRNSVFPDDLHFVGTGGILYTLKNCPKKFSSHYDMKLWEEWYTTVPN